MKVTVIGFWGGFPGVGEATSGYLLEHDGFHMLVDCGSGVLSNLQRYLPVEKLDAVILSHYHHDHIADIGVLQYGRLIKKNLGLGLDTLPIYGHRFDGISFERLTHDPYTRGYAYDPEQMLKIGPFSISFLKTKHPVTCYAMRISAGGKTIVYTADTSYMDSFIPFADQAELLISECNFYKGQDGTAAGHMNSIDAATLAAKADVGELLLTHLPHFGNLQDLKKQAESVFSGSVSLAESGWTWG